MEMARLLFKIRHIRKNICLLLIFCLLLRDVPLLLADDMLDFSGQGESFGQDIFPDAQNIFEVSGDDYILFPGSEGELAIGQESLFPGSSAQSIEDYTSLYGGSEHVFTQAVDGNIESLESGSNMTGQAFQTIYGGIVSNPRLDLRNDPIWGNTDQTLEDIFSESFEDCTIQTIVTDTSYNVHMPEYENCERLVKYDGNCTIEHKIKLAAEDVDIVFVIDRTSSMGSEINTLQANLFNFINLLEGLEGNIRLGVYGYNSSKNIPYWGRIQLTSDFQAIHTFISGLTLAGNRENAPTAIHAAANMENWRPEAMKIIHVIGNNQMFCLNCNEICSKPGSVTWQAARDALIANDVTMYYSHNKPHEIANFGIKLGNRFEYEHLIELTKFIVVLHESWEPEGCLNQAIAVDDGFCQGDFTFTPDPVGECEMIDYFPVCVGDAVWQKFADPPVSGFDKMHAEVYVGPLDCDYNEGEFCWEDHEGNEQCYTFDPSEEILDSCQELEDDPNCGFINSQCVEGSETSSGVCLVFEEIYDCGFDVEVEDFEIIEVYNCDGDIRCMGSECISRENESNNSFGQALAAFEAAQAMQQDMNCVGTDCKIFKGDKMECKKAVGGMVDCCKKPGTTNFKDYIQFLRLSMKLSDRTGQLFDTFPGLPSGGWSAFQDLTSSAGQMWSKLKEPFVKGWEGFTGKVIPSAMEETLKSFSISNLTTKAAQWAVNKFGEQAASMVFTMTMDGAGNVVSAQLGGMVLGPIMWAYTAYQIFVILVQIIWQCTENEFALGVKRELKSCKYIGSYCKTEFFGSCLERRRVWCCFNSPLSRIMQEQIRPQLGIGWGKAKSPNCSALSISQLENVDWSNINLNEWIGMLSLTGLMPGYDSSRLTQDGLTGSGSLLNTEGDRLSTFERTTGYLEDIDVDEGREETKQGLWQEYLGL
jgi:conjugal transfer mating pair stabilization protein TraN